MTTKSHIQWTDATWNPTTGCTRVSAGCDNCYAFALHDRRYKNNLDAARIFFRSNDNALEPLGFKAVATQEARDQGAALPWPKQYDKPFSRVQLLEDRLDAPLRVRKPSRWFVDSMSDLFHEDVPDEYLDRVFFTMVFATWHTFQILTKRPERMRRYIESRPIGPELPAEYVRARFRHIDGVDLGKTMAGEAAYAWPSPNIWLGTSVEDQAAAEERIPHLLATPAAVRFLSCEPLLGPIDLSVFADEVRLHSIKEHRGVGWVIIGGESGPRARPMDLRWARYLVDQCKASGVAVFVKQLGADPIETCQDGSHPGEGHDIDLRDRKGGDMTEWPEDLRVREWPR